MSKDDSNNTKSDSENENEFDEHSEADKYFIPKSECVQLRHGQKSITSTSIEPTGNRLLTGSKDCSMSLWDFNGMNSSAASFKSVNPCQQEIKATEWSTNGEHALVVSNDIQAFIVDREGERVLETIKGIPGFFDPRSTKGHNNMLNGGCWSPRYPEELLTCSGDGSLRIWNILDYEKILGERRIKSHKTCIVPTSTRGKKSIPTACRYSSSGQLVLAGCGDGSVHVWDTRKSFTKSDLKCSDAHPVGSVVTSIRASFDDVHVLTRAMDGSMKLFDIRTGLKAPLHAFADLYVTDERTNCVFSPNDRLVATGTSLREDAAESFVVFYSRDTFEEVDRLTMPSASAVTLEWHPRLNQVLVGSSVGTLDLYYDRRFSRNGALNFVGKCAKPQKAVNVCYTKGTLLTYGDEREGPELTQFMKVKKEMKKRIPQQPTEANNKYPTHHQYLVQQIAIPKRTPEAEYYENHPREAILRHANAPRYWTAGAYDKTQPKQIFDCDDDEPDTKKSKMI